MMNEASKKQPIYCVGLLRFIFILSIMFYHLQWSLFNQFETIPLYRYFLKSTWSGDQGVEFFFILAGFFLIYTYKDIPILDFIKKKVARLWPVVCFCFLVKLVLFPLIKESVHGWDLSLSLLFLDGIGVSIRPVGETWFVSVLFWVSLFYFSLFKTFSRSKAILIVALITWFCYVFEIHANVGGIRGTDMTWGYVFNTGVMRGLASIGLGILIGVLCDAWRGRDIGKTGKVIWTCLEVICLFATIAFPLFIKNPFHNIMILICLFSIMLFSFVMQKGYLSQALNKESLFRLGNGTYSIYLTHLMVFYSFKNFWLHNTSFVLSYPILNIFLVLVVSLLFGYAVYKFVEIPGSKHLKRILFQ